MKILINLFIIVALISFTHPAYSQCQDDDCEPQLTGAGIDVACFDYDSTATFIVGWAMGAGDFNCSAPDSSFIIQVSFPASGLWISDDPANDVLQPSMFDWTYSVANNTWTGINNQTVHWGDGGEAKIRAKGVIPNNCAVRIFPVQIYLYPNVAGGCQQAFIDDPDNNFLDPCNGVANPLSITLSDFIAKPECKVVQISFIVSNPVNNHFMEVQRSVDGRHFSTINKIIGDNKRESLKYKIADFQVNEGTTYYYRLRQVDFDGTETFFDPIVVRTPICDGEKTLTVYPNPVMNRLYLDVTGFESGEKGNIIIRNSIGETVQVFKDVVINDFKEIDVLNYVSGSYTIQLESAGSQFVQKFIKIE